MSDRNNIVPLPNFLGGFLCGFLSVLAFAWLGGIAMWIAGTLGFVIGCWPKEIFASVAAACQACVIYAPAAVRGLFAFQYSLILRAAKYVFSNQYRRLYFLRVLVVLLLTPPWIAFTLAAMLPLARTTNATPPVQQIGAAVMFMGGLIFGASCCLFPSLVMLFADDDSVTRRLARIRYLRSLRSRREEKGLLYCLGYDVLGTLKRQLAIAFVLVFGACAGLLLLVTIVVVALGVLIIRGVLLLNSRASGIICLVLALLATACSAWTLSDYLSGALLWVIAVGTGCFAGSATVAGRELVIRAVPYASDRVHAFAKQTIASRIEPLTKLWLKPEGTILTVALTSPETA